MEITDNQAAYIAGIVDGEGYLAYNKKVHKQSKRGVYYAATVVVANTNFELIEWLHELTGLGSVHDVDRGGNTQPVKRWTLWSRHSMTLLERILPYLIVKKRQAQMILATKTSENPCSRGLSDEEWDRRERTYTEVKLLNLRGRRAA